MNIFRKSKETKLYKFLVAGTSYNQANLKPLFDEDITHNATVKAEPTNTHDKNALKVSVGRRKIGYIYKTDQAEYHALKKQGIVDCFVELEKLGSNVDAYLYIRA